VAEPDFDFVVVGSGFGGAVSALRLSEKGYRVAVIEKGKRFKDADFPEKGWQVWRYLWLPVARLFGPQAYTFLSDMMVAHGVGVGGGSLVYANTLMKPPDAVFDDPAWARLGKWSEDLAPHFREARRMLGATEAPDQPPLDDHLLHLARSYRREESFGRTDVGVFLGEGGREVPDPYFGGDGPTRTGCIRCGGCMSGCRHNAKNTLDKNYLHLAERMGAQILPQTEVRSLEEADGGLWKIHVGQSTAWVLKKRRTLTARAVVLAGGVMGTVSLLHRCRQKGMLTRLPSGVGHHTRTNCEALVGAGDRSPGVDHTQGISISAGFSPDDKTHVEMVRLSPAMSGLALLTTFAVPENPPWPRWLGWVAKAIRHPLRLLRIFNPWGWSKRVAMLLFMQVYDTHLVLEWRRRRLIPWTFTLDSKLPRGARFPRSIPDADSMAQDLCNTMGDADALGALPEVIFGKMSTAHVLGGCAMGVDADSGVVNPKGQVFGYTNLFIADGSIIPGNLSVNPALTITALAEWVMDQIPAREKNASFTKTEG
jgi:cholesterol oxidase